MHLQKGAELELEQQENDQVILTDIKRFEMFFKDQYSPLVNYANTILHDLEESEDKVQQVFISLWEKRKTIQAHTSLRAFLYKSVYNACLNKIKHNKVREVYAKENPMTDLSLHPENGIEEKELQKKIDAAIQLLPEQCRKIFIMSRYEHLKYQEIADQLGLSIKTVENQMGKALKIMREALKEYLSFVLLLILNQ